MASLHSNSKNCFIISLCADDGENSSPVSPLIAMSQNDEELPNGMNMLALKPENDKKTSNYDLYKKEGGENSTTDMFQVGLALFLSLFGFRDTISTR